MSIVSEEQIIKVLRQYNPWWRAPSSIKEESKPQKRLAYYEALRIIKHPTLRRFAVLSGARRVGKTTIMYQMIEHLIEEGINPQNILYVSFDNPIVKLVNVDTVLSIYETLYPIEGTRYLFLDEIQYTDHWELWMKVIYDHRKEIRLTATGSASPLLEKGAADSGTGRWSVLKIPTMSFYEYCRLLQLEEPILPDKLRLTELVKMSQPQLGDLIDRFTPLESQLPSILENRLSNSSNVEQYLTSIIVYFLITALGILFSTDPLVLVSKNSITQPPTILDFRKCYR